MNDKRPKNLNLFTIHFPIPAIVSILHRISGAFLFLLIPFVLWFFSLSLTDAGFITIKTWLDNSLIKLIIWLALLPFCFHLVAGIRHLLMDIHIGSSLQGSRLSSFLTFVFTFLLAILIGVWLW